MLHRHATDCPFVAIGDGTLQAADADGTKRPVMALKDGQVVFRKLDGQDTHAAVNVGATPWRNIVVELKQN